jgi:hypothetical protein
LFRLKELKYRCMVWTINIISFNCSISFDFDFLIWILIFSIATESFSDSNS